MAPPQIVLLTHEREVDKPTNTGRLVLEVLGDAATRIVWRRAAPDPGLLRLVAAGDAALLWPSPRASTLQVPTEPRVVIVVDGTWQQARKIYNRSPYLHALPTIALDPEVESIYTLRRNQIAGGLCTAEAVAQLLGAPGAAPDGPTLAVQLIAGLQRLVA